MFYRGRRLRSNEVLREMVQETNLLPQHLIMPYFVVETEDTRFQNSISSMPGQFQFCLQTLREQVAKAVDMGLRSCILFGLPAAKDPAGSGAYAPDGIVQKAVALLKKDFPALQVMTDVCLCEYTSHGHCGMIDPQGNVQNDATLPLLAQIALSHAEAGADIVAPSDMMDGRIGAIRELLDDKGFTNLPIMSYAVKYASAFYGPFRDAADSSPQYGDRKTYQMDPRNRREAMREAEADLAEGADMLMVKPAGAYLDIIRDVRNAFDVPLGAYQVSGEYAMIKAAGQNGWIDEPRIVLESLLGIRRAGADLILTYFAEDVLRQRLY